MQVFIDGDGTPNIKVMLDICSKKQIDVVVYVDYNHMIDDERVVLCDQGKDSVDFKILQQVKKDDIVITQDYGLAELILAKNARVLHVSGFEITATNIDELLFRRFLSYKERKRSKRIIGPSKRSFQDQKRFIDAFEQMTKIV